MITNEEAQDHFNKAITQAFSEGYNKGYNKGYEDGLRELLEEKEAPSDYDIRYDLGKVKDTLTNLEGRVRKLERAFYGD